VTLVVPASAAARRALRTGRALPVTLQVSFRPRRGAALTARAVFSLRRTPARRG
jgi:hypothetical protein